MRTAIYCRVSSEDQVEFGTKYCDLHQYEITDWYKDDGVTGTIPLELRPAGSTVPAEKGT